jgi:hypothetical protein
LTPCCGFEVYNPTQALKSVQGPGNTLHLNPKWERTVPFFGNFSKDIHRVPPKNPNIKVDNQLCYLDLFWRTIFISHEKMTQNSKVISHLGFNSRVFAEPLTDIGAWVL